jgi:opacity protein-like surface antigen
VTPIRALSSLSLLSLPTRVSVSLSAIALALGLLLWAPASLAAEDQEQKQDEGYQSYFEFSTGASFVPFQNVRDGSVSQGRIEPDTGFFVGAALGTYLMDGVRVEFRLDYHEADIDQASLVGPASTADGKVSLISAMVNGYYDLDLGIGVIPYAGFGIGYGAFQLDVRRKTPGLFDIDDTDHVFVYNAMVGARIPISKVSEVAIGYRYLSAVGTDDMGSIIGGVQQNLRTEYDAHEVTLGLRFNF